MTKFTILVLTASLSVVTHVGLAAEPAQTARSDTPPQMLIRFADLDLAGPDGASVLFHRIRRAAKIVCSPLESKDPAHYATFQRCVTDAMARAVTQVDRPALNAYYRGKVQGSNAAPAELARN